MNHLPERRDGWVSRRRVLLWECDSGAWFARSICERSTVETGPGSHRLHPGAVVLHVAEEPLITVAVVLGSVLVHEIASTPVMAALHRRGEA